MYSLTCPKCGRVLTSPRPYRQGRFRCPECKEVFTGSTRPAGQAEPRDSGKGSRPKPPARPRIHHSAPRPPVSRWVVLVCIGASLATAILGVVGWYYYTGPFFEQEKSASTALVRPALEPGTTTRAAGAGRSATSRPAGSQRRGPAASEPVIPEGDKMITAGLRVEPSGIPGSSTVVGDVHNGYNHALAKVNVTVAAYDYSGKVLAARKAVCQYVPPMAALGFVVDFQNLPRWGVARYAAVAQGVKAPLDEVCWRFDAKHAVFDTSGLPNTAVVRGQVRNRAETALSDVRIFSDFHLANGIYQCTVIGKLEGSDRMEVGQTLPYKVLLDGNRRGIMIQTIQSTPVLRLVGRRAESVE